MLGEDRVLLDDLPDGVLLEVFKHLDQRPRARTRFAVLSTCKRFCLLWRTYVPKCDALCAWPEGPGAPAGLPGMLWNMPQLVSLRLQDIPDWVAQDPAALQELLAARQDAAARPHEPLWYTFCKRGLWWHSPLQSPALQPVHFLTRRRDVDQLVNKFQQMQILLSELTEQALFDDGLATWYDEGLRRALGPARRQLCWDPHLPHPLQLLTALRDLDLSGCSLDLRGAHALASLTRLSHLSLGMSHEGTIAAALRALGGLTSLLSINLSVCGPVLIRGHHQLLAQMTQLQHLTLYRANLTDQSCLLPLTALRTLCLAGSRNMTDAGTALLVSSLPYLRHLGLRATSGGTLGWGAASMAAIGTRTALISLDLSFNSFLALLPGFGGSLRQLSQLEALSVASINLNGAGMSAISTLTALSCLDIGRNPWLGQFATSLRPLARLETLAAPRTSMDGGVDQIAHLTNLKSLNLAHNSLTPASACVLIRLTGLTYLNIEGNLP